MWIFWGVTSGICPFFFLEGCYFRTIFCLSCIISIFFIFTFFIFCLTLFSRLPNKALRHIDLFFLSFICLSLPFFLSQFDLLSVFLSFSLSLFLISRLYVLLSSLLYLQLDTRGAATAAPTVPLTSGVHSGFPPSPTPHVEEYLLSYTTITCPQPSLSTTPKKVQPQLQPLSLPPIFPHPEAESASYNPFPF